MNFSVKYLLFFNMFFILILAEFNIAQGQIKEEEKPTHVSFAVTCTRTNTTKCIPLNRPHLHDQFHESDENLLLLSDEVNWIHSRLEEIKTKETIDLKEEIEKSVLTSYQYAIKNLISSNRIHISSIDKVLFFKTSQFIFETNQHPQYRSGAFINGYDLYCFLNSHRIAMIKKKAFTKRSFFSYYYSPSSALEIEIAIHVPTEEMSFFYLPQTSIGQGALKKFSKVLNLENFRTYARGMIHFDELYQENFRIDHLKKIKENKRLQFLSELNFYERFSLQFPNGMIGLPSLKFHSHPSSPSTELPENKSIYLELMPFTLSQKPKNELVYRELRKSKMEFSIIHEIAMGPKILHENFKLTHNDIKPDNILVGLNPYMKAALNDFDLLLNPGELIRDGKNRNRLGTIFYFAPELFMIPELKGGEKGEVLMWPGNNDQEKEEFAYRTDVYGLGIIGHLVFHKELPDFIKFCKERTRSMNQYLFCLSVTLKNFHQNEMNSESFDPGNLFFRASFEIHPKDRLSLNQFILGIKKLHSFYLENFISPREKPRWDFSQLDFLGPAPSEVESSPQTEQNLHEKYPFLQQELTNLQSCQVGDYGIFQLNESSIESSADTAAKKFLIFKNRAEKIELKVISSKEKIFYFMDEMIGFLKTIGLLNNNEKVF
jgi:serine/threonine protein kinase